MRLAASRQCCDPTGGAGLQTVWFMVRQNVKLSRRGFLSALGVYGGALALHSPRPAFAAGTAPVIAMASSLRFCADELVAAFVGAGGAPLRLVFGSSGTLVRQIENGAPFAMFLSADEGFALRLVNAGLTIDRGAVYGIGRLALVAHNGLAGAKEPHIKIDREMKGLAAALSLGRVTRFAIANPNHAPYGVRARQALQHARLWQALQGKLALGENVAQAAQFAGSGAADAGLIANSLARTPRFARRVTQALIPASWHAPLPQRMVMLAAAVGPQRARARKFYSFMGSNRARKILQRNGFDLPELH